MQTYFLIPAFYLASVLTTCGQNNNKVPEQFQQYINQVTVPIEQKEVIPYYGNANRIIPDFLTKKEALADVEMFEYLVKTSYSGYEYWSCHGDDITAYFSKLRFFVNQKDSISTDEFEAEWAKFLDLIRDGHISLFGKKGHGAYNHQSVYFSEIVVEKTIDGQYKVINSMFDQVKTGDLFTQNEIEKYLFKTLSPVGKNHYLVGLLSFSPVVSQPLSFNDKTIEVPFYENQLNLANLKNQSVFNIERKNSIPVLTITSFVDGRYPLMKKFIESGNQLKNEKQLIVDVMNNGGGSSQFPQTFIKNLNGSAHWESYWAILNSPSIVEYFANYDLNSGEAQSPGFRNLILHNKEELAKYHSSPAKKWEFSTTTNDNDTGAYNGRMIVLTNRYVISGGEAFVGVSQSVKNRIVVGENTAGCGMFSSACGYCLPNSKFIANLPRHFILIPGFEECIGFIPDYWLNTTEPVKEVMNWINDPDNYRFTYSMSYDDIKKKQDFSMSLPDDLKIVTPDTDIPEDVARFSGKWLGKSGGILDHLLVVENIHDSQNIDAIYAWGTAPQWNIYKPGWQRFRGKIENKKLVLTDGNVTITYEFISDKELDATYQKPGVYSTVKLTKLK